ncbi:MAG: MFS transporter, OPA family, glycerol-3-phosphate transporter [bacterium]|nr:MAG: MFS transporter, OPA family, glycerol-3-phosphate transporter [bacterium]
MPTIPDWLTQLLAIGLLLGAIALVVANLPKVELGHSPAFLKRRLWNWLPLGLTYAFLYMGRYNLTVSKNALGELMSTADFGTIFFWGTLTYGVAFVINGPLTDRWGGRRTILIAAAGSATCNLVLGLVTWLVIARGWHPPGGGLVPIFSVVYAANMYFQSFGAVSIVKVNAAWFHVRERGILGGLFGILISLGLYFAYDWSGFIVKHAPTYWVFIVPAIILTGFWIIDYFIIRDTPGEAGQADFDVADASSGDTGPAPGLAAVAKRMFTNPVIVTISLIEFCSGFLRNAVMQWYIIFAKQVGIAESFVPKNWGLLLCVAGITGGMLAGVISDHVFHSRRGPVAAMLYGGLMFGAVMVLFLLSSPLLGFVAIFMSLCFIGVHGMLSGTASADFGGRKNAGVAVGIIDGLVYLGTATQSLLLGKILPAGEAAKNPENWRSWPLAMIPVSVIGFLLCLRLWNSRPNSGKSAAAH